MPIPSLNIAITSLSTPKSSNLAIWVVEAPVPMSTLEDTSWPDVLTRRWLAWQEMFSNTRDSHLPYPITPNADLDLSDSNPQESYSGRLMQALGVGLWQWILTDTIRPSFAQCKGLALGQQQPLRFRLEIQSPNLVPLPWEIMQPEVGTQALTLNPQILFSRTISKVEPLILQPSRNSIAILLVVGEQVVGEQNDGTDAVKKLDLEQEAQILANLIEEHNEAASRLTTPSSSVKIQVHSLIQPSAAQLIEALDSGLYNVIFYAGHGMPDPDGGLLFLSPQTKLNGTEFAQALVRNQIKLAVFNSCWGAKSAQINSQVIERSSLAEVLICHGVPAVVAMRDAIADPEALALIREFTKALTERIPIDQSIQVARQQLLTLYGFNQPTWTLPILYMHPQFDGELVSPGMDTVLPYPQPEPIAPYPVAYFRSLNDREEQWRMSRKGRMKIGRRSENDLVVAEPWVSKHHAEIICRSQNDDQYDYVLQDHSSFGTLVLTKGQWQKVHNQDLTLTSGVQIKFGSTEGQIFEFIVEMLNN
ncbi:MAG: CHAT domain-containing protein [Microcystaceae cyanobacterium]